MPNTISVGGKQVKKSTLLLAGGATGLVAFLWFRHQSSSSSSASAAPSTAAGTSAGYGTSGDGTTGNPSDPNSIDPSTGMTYGEENSMGGYGGYGYGGYGSGYGSGYGYGSYPPSTPGPGSFTSNAQWAQYAEQQLQGVVDETALSAALGKYLTSQPMTQDQEGLTDQAIAIAGYPPVSGPGGFPPSMHQTGSTGHPGGGGNITVPHVIGEPAGEAFNVITAAGLEPDEASRSIHPDWIVTSQSPSAGAKVSSGSKVRYNAKAPSSHGGGGHPGTQVTVPNVVGQSQENAFENLSDAGLHATGSRTVHGKVLIVQRQNPKAGSKVNKGSTVHLTSKLSR